MRIYLYPYPELRMLIVPTHRMNCPVLFLSRWIFGVESHFLEGQG